MQTDAQAGDPFGSRDRIPERWGSDHQARGSQHTVEVRFLDGFVYRFGETKIVPGHDELFHDRISRETRRPSRVRVNFEPRQMVVLRVSARNHETSPARSRKGSNARLFKPSRSRKPHPSVMAAVAIRTSMAAPRTASPTPSSRRIEAKRRAKGVDRIMAVARNATGRAARAFWSQYTWWFHHWEGLFRSTIVSIKYGTMEIFFPEPQMRWPIS